MLIHQNRSTIQAKIGKATLDAWYRIHTPRLLRKLRKYHLNTHECEDIVHDTWYTILRVGYTGDGVFSAFVTRIAERKAIDVLRSHARSRFVPLEHVAHELHVLPPFNTQAVRDTLRYMAMQLSLVQAMAYITIKYAGISYFEASVLLHAPQTTLRTRIRRCTTLLRAPARYTTFPTSIALPVGYAPVGIAWRALPQDDQEYTVFVSDKEQQDLEVICVH